MPKHGKRYARYFFSTVILPALLLTTGCAHRIGDFSVLSSGAPQYASMDRATITRTVEGTDGRLWFLFIPFGGAPNLEEAVDRCLDEGNGDFIERVRLYETGWSILLFSYGSYKVIGDVGNSKKPKPDVERAGIPPVVPAATPSVPAGTSRQEAPAAVQPPPVTPQKRIAKPAPEPAETAADTASENAPNAGTAETVSVEAETAEAPEKPAIQTEDLGGLLSGENR